MRADLYFAYPHDTTFPVSVSVYDEDTITWFRSQLTMSEGPRLLRHQPGETFNVKNHNYARQLAGMFRNKGLTVDEVELDEPKFEARTGFAAGWAS